MNEIDVIDILDPVTDEVVTHCFGPTTAGQCPLASPDGIVHCHGARMIALDGRGLSKHRGAELGAGVLESLDPAGITACPSMWHLVEVGRRADPGHHQPLRGAGVLPGAAQILASSGQLTRKD